MKTDIEKGIDVEIDEITHCVKDASTGKDIKTSYVLVDKEELVGLKKKGWLFNWNDKSLREYDIYKLTLERSTEIQGLIAIKKDARNIAYYVNLVESAPHNKGKNKKYIGVGGNLFAIAVKKSKADGFGGFVYFEAKNVELVEHYTKMLRARWIGHPRPYSMIIEEENAEWLLKEYSLD